MAPPEIALTLLAGSPGQPVVIVGPSLGTRVERLWSTAAGLLSGYRVIGWDLPGHGRSAPVTRPYDTQELAGAVLRAVDAAVGVDLPLRYAGDSFGGCVGLQLIVDHPERFEAAAILCSGAKIATAEVWRQRVDLVCREGLRPVQGASAQRWFGERVLAQPNDESRAVVEELADIDALSYCHACAALGVFDVRDRLSAIQVPLLAIAGSDDLVTTAEQNRELVRHTPGASFELLPGVGHLAPLEDPAATVALLEKHFAKESSR
ncbi:MAG TPA: alpha/beta fold hydrolase [Flexivirga sp.]|uniref:alpha/beta fold hydrolase n=1 Tax=Flexivirga sp. TaxID=1962927 RepID=UPI002BFD7F37|nr:alpha/beta fold hydrolase [Flexivirga sp.]HWC21655.1 alpha/beta fold hydrolase [Flexivirga sp.]